MAEFRRPRGFSLVEQLVALLLVATALLGVAGLQLGSLRAGAHALERLSAHDHVVARAEGVRALHGLTIPDRALLFGTGAALGCRGDRLCTPREFAADEAARAAADAAARGWSVVPSVAALDHHLLRATLELRRADRRLAHVGVES